jgi:hypothetical protein
MSGVVGTSDRSWLCRLHPWLPHLRNLTGLSLALTYPSSWSELLPVSLLQLEISNITSAAHMCPCFFMTRLTRLTSLALQCIPSLDDAFIKSLSPLTALQRLFLCCTAVTGVGFQGIVLPSLQHVTIGGVADSAVLQYLSAAAPRLRDLRLDQCGKVLGVPRLCVWQRSRLLCVMLTRAFMFSRRF